MRNTETKSAAIKSEIRKSVKRTGSHLGAVKAVITNKFEGVDFEEYKEFTNELIIKKLKNTKSTIRASVRF
jgi:hypothetical protein